MNAHKVTEAFEEEVARYTGAPYCVAVSSCTAALELCLAKLMAPGETIHIPARTYVSVPQVIIKSGGLVKFHNICWVGAYQLSPLPIWDCAKRFRRNMYSKWLYQCLSFHSAKILGDTQGGAILCDDEEDAKWFKKARFDGRDASQPLRDDKEIFIGYHCYMSPDVSTRLLLRMQGATFKESPDQGPDLMNEYSDLSKLECFQPYAA